MKYFLLSALVLIITFSNCSAQIVVSQERNNTLSNADIEKMPFSALGNMKFIRNDSTKKVEEFFEYKGSWLSAWFFPKSRIWIRYRFTFDVAKDGAFIRLDDEGRVVEIGHYKNNRKHGNWIIYREQGVFVEIWKKGKIKYETKLNPS